MRLDIARGSQNLCTNDFVLQPLGIFSSKPSVPMKLCWSAGIFRLQFFVLRAVLNVPSFYFKMSEFLDSIVNTESIWSLQT